MYNVGTLEGDSTERRCRRRRRNYRQGRKYRGSEDQRPLGDVERTLPTRGTAKAGVSIGIL